MFKKITLFFIVFISFNLYSMQFLSDQEYNFGNLVVALSDGSYNDVYKILERNPFLILEKSINHRNIFDYIQSAEYFYEDDELDLSRIRLFLIEKLIDLLSENKKNIKNRRYWKKILKKEVGLLPVKISKVRLILAIKNI